MSDKLIKIDTTFCFAFLSAPFSLGHERERGGLESQASVCFIGGNPVLLRAEPIKQKTRRPERRGIARAVSPKKMREEKKGGVEDQERRTESRPGERIG